MTPSNTNAQGTDNEIENRMLLLQLHQVQEELLQSYVSGKQKNQHISQLEQRIQQLASQPVNLPFWQRLTDKLGYTQHRAIAEIRKSEYMDTEWYRIRYPDVAASGMDPVIHFFRFGWQENRHPGPNFDTLAYLSNYPDVKQSGMNPLLHYLQFGRHEGRHVSAVKGGQTSAILMELEYHKQNTQRTKRQLLAAEQQRMRLEHSLSTLRPVVDENVSLQHQIQQLNTALSASSSLCDEKTTQIDRLSKLLEEQSQLLNMHQSEKQQLIDANVKLNAKLESIEQQLGECAGAFAVSEKLHDENARLHVASMQNRDLLLKAVEMFGLQAEAADIDVQSRSQQLLEKLRQKKVSMDALNNKQQQLIASSDTLASFLYHCQKLFYGKSITYVDVGAFNGEFAKTLFASDLSIHEAHLFEAEAGNYALLSHNMHALQKKPRQLVCYELAVSDQPGLLSINAKKNMSQIMLDADQDTSTLSSVEAVTLDSMKARFTEQHISLLKIDVEGHEMHVLRGANSLFEAQAVDMVYIEAGLNPDGHQQCYYRLIDDFMVSRGYRLFRIFEQQYEWLEDSPLLRRFNLAYLSQRFSQTVPMKVINEIYMLKTQQNTHSLQSF